MKNTIINYLKRPFIRNVFILASGTAVSQIVNILFAPLITRMYGPEAYGLMGTFQSIIAIIAPIVALSYPIAIVLPVKDSEAKQIAKLSLIVTFILTLLILLPIIFLKESVVKLMNLEINSYVLYFIPLTFIMASLLQVMDNWLIRKSQFNVSAKSNLIEVLITNSGKLTMGLLKPVSLALIVFTAFRQGITALLMFIFSDKSLITDNQTDSNRSELLLNIVKKYKDFPLYRAPETFFNATAGSLPLLLLTSFFGPVAAGFYTLARSVLGAPITLIGNAVGKVFFLR